jgi:hypothetical protein
VVGILHNPRVFHLIPPNPGPFHDYRSCCITGDWKIPVRKFQRLENAALAALLAFAAAGAARAELHFQEVVLDNSYFAYERDVGDVDGDGDNDVVAIQEGETKLEVFKAPTWARSTLVTFTGTYRWPRADDFKVGDIDGDGDMDLITRLGAGPPTTARGWPCGARTSAPAPAGSPAPSGTARRM